MNELYKIYYEINNNNYYKILIVKKFQIITKYDQGLVNNKKVWLRLRFRNNGWIVVQ